MQRSLSGCLSDGECTPRNSQLSTVNPPAICPPDVHYWNPPCNQNLRHSSVPQGFGFTSTSSKAGQNAYKSQNFDKKTVPPAGTCTELEEIL